MNPDHTFSISPLMTRLVARNRVQNPDLSYFAVLLLSQVLNTLLRTTCSNAVASSACHTILRGHSSAPESSKAKVHSLGPLGRGLCHSLSEAASPKRNALLRM